MGSLRGRGHAWLALLGCIYGLVAAASCSSDRRHDDGSTPIPPLRVGPPVDLQKVMTRASRAFRADGSALVAATTTFEARVEGGALVVRPRRKGAAREEALALHTSRISRGSHVLSSAQPAVRLEPDGSIRVDSGEVAERLDNDESGIEQSWRFERAPAGQGDLVVQLSASGKRYTKSTDHGLHFGAPGSVGLRYSTATWVDANGKRTVVRPGFADGAIVMVVPEEVLTASSYPAVLDPTITPEHEIDQPVTGSSASGEQYNPAVVSAGPGKGFLAVWYDRRGVRPSLYATRIASDGSVLDDTGISVATGVASATPSVSSSGNGFLVTWAVSYLDIYQSPGIYAVRLDASGKPLDTAPLKLPGSQTSLAHPSSAFDGTSWLVAWQHNGGSVTGYDIAGARVGQTGAALDATPLEISKGAEAEYEPIVTFDGTSQFVTFRSYSQIFGRKLGKDGKPLTNRILLASQTATSLYDFSVTFDGTQHLLVWSNYGTSSYDVYARRIALSGAPLDPGNLIVSATGDYDDHPRAAWDGTSFVITYSRSGNLGAQRMSAAGALLDAAATIVNTVNSYYSYDLASDGVGTIALTRSTSSGLAGSDVAGVLVGKPPIANASAFTVSRAANSETEPAIAYDGADHLVVWLDTRDGRPAIYGASVSVDGQPSATTRIVSDPRFSDDLRRPRIASDGAGGYLVVFYADDTVATRRGIRGVRVDSAGKPDATGVFDIHVPATPDESAQDPDVAFDGTNYLVVWQNQANDGTYKTSIHGVRLPKTGVSVIDTEPIRVTTVTPVDSRTAASVAFDGQNYFVTWITSRPAPGGDIQVSHVYGSRVSKEGNVLDGEQVICNAFLLQRAPYVAADVKNGGFMVVWEDYRTSLETADVYGARISAQGQNLDGTSGMKIAVGGHDESRPRVAPSGDGTNWVVAWRDLRSKTTYDIYSSWISVAGKNHDPEGLLVSADPGDEDAPWLSASTGGKLLVSYQRLDPRAGYGSYRVRARSVSSGAKKVASPCTKDDDCASRSCVDGFCCYTACEGCGTCSVTPGTCTPRAANSESPTCPGYRCKGKLECPNTCESDADCASSATCDPQAKKCVSRIICIDDQTLKDLSGKTTPCAPYKCTADACRTQCGSVDDCAQGFVCDYGGRCTQAPTGDDGGCAVASTSSPSASILFIGALWGLAAISRRRKRTG